MLGRTHRRSRRWPSTCRRPAAAPSNPTTPRDSYRGEVAELAIWSQIAVRQPHTGEWVILIKELGELAEWVRTQAVPILITGAPQEGAPLPARIDLNRPWEDALTAALSGTHTAATQAHLHRVMAPTARETLATLTTHVECGPSLTASTAWVASLSDEEVLQRVGQIHGADPTLRTSISHLTEEQLHGRVSSMSLPPALFLERLEALAREATSWASGRSDDLGA